MSERMVTNYCHLCEKRAREDELDAKAWALLFRYRDIQNHSSPAPYEDWIRDVCELLAEKEGQR